MNDLYKFCSLSQMGEKASIKSPIEYLRGTMDIYHTTMAKIKSKDLVR